LVSTPVVHLDGNQNGAGGTPSSVGGTSIRPHAVNARPQPIRGAARTHPSLEEVSISAAAAAIVPAPRRGRISSSAPQFFRSWASPTSYYGLWCLASVAPQPAAEPRQPTRQPSPGQCQGMAGQVRHTHTPADQEPTVGDDPIPKPLLLLCAPAQPCVAHGHVARRRRKYIAARPGPLCCRQPHRRSNIAGARQRHAETPAHAVRPP